MDKNSEVFSAPFEYTLSILGGKWKMIIMFWLFKRNILRYGELKENITGITHKVLSKQLKDILKMMVLLYVKNMLKFLLK